MKIFKVFSQLLVHTMWILILIIAASTSYDAQAAPLLQTEYITYLPLVYRPPFPGENPFTTSYYMKTIDATELQNMGCAIGNIHQNLAGYQRQVVVLAFGYPMCKAGNEYATYMYGFGEPTTVEIASAVINMGAGYYACSAGDVGSQLIIGVGTNNKNYSCTTNTQINAHGRAWATMINNINQYFIDHQMFNQVSAWGASDMELAWSGPAFTRAWVDGYDAQNQHNLINFGDAAGCPYDNNGWSCGTATYPQWTPEDVWYISYGASPSYPFPLIYLRSGVHAKQWATLSLYGYLNHGYRMDFLGPFTQWQACQQRGCINTDNTPEQALYQLWDEVNSNPNTAQDFPYWTDIKWMYE